MVYSNLKMNVNQNVKSGTFSIRFTFLL